MVRSECQTELTDRQWPLTIAQTLDACLPLFVTKFKIWPLKLYDYFVNAMVFWKWKCLALSKPDPTVAAAAQNPFEMWEDSYWWWWGGGGGGREDSDVRRRIGLSFARPFPNPSQMKIRNPSYCLSVSLSVCHVGKRTRSEKRKEGTVLYTGIS